MPCPNDDVEESLVGPEDRHVLFVFEHCEGAEAVWKQDDDVDVAEHLGGNAAHGTVKELGHDRALAEHCQNLEEIVKIMFKACQEVIKVTS